MATAFAIELVLAVGTLALYGVAERGTDIALQMTARFSFLLFLPAYCGGALAVLFGPPWDMLRQRARNFGLSFAAAHLVHLGLVVWLCFIGAVPPVGTFEVFGFAAVWLYLLAALSIDRLHRAVGKRVWRLLHLIGLNVLAVAFALDFLKFPAQADAVYLLGYLPFDVVALAGPALRLAAWGVQIYQSRRKSAFQLH